MKIVSSILFFLRQLQFGGSICAGAVLLVACSVRAQNLFVSVYPSHIYEFTPSGAQSIFASGLTPQGLAFNSAGDLFVANAPIIGASNIKEITPGGVISTFATGLAYPQGLAFNSAGDLFVVDAGGSDSYIYKYTPGGARSTFAFVQGQGPADGLAFNSAGDLFVSCPDSGTIFEYTPGGVQSTFASGLNDPFGLAFNSAGNLFVTLNGSGKIYEYTPGGVQNTFASGLKHPLGLAFDSAGNLFVANAGAHNIYEYMPGGAQSTFASGLPDLGYLASMGVALPVPEPSAWALLAVGVTALSVRYRKLTAWLNCLRSLIH
jgi:DNA-binding beta-propeller fold protein YncE